LIILDSIQGLSPHGEQYEGKADKEKSVEDDTMALLARKLSQFFRILKKALRQEFGE
jgi:RecA/RadA recombinase